MNPAMCKRCGTRLEALVRHALGEASGELCPECVRTAAEIRKISDGLKLAVAEAPEELVDRAKAIFAAERRSSVAKVVGSSLAAAGVRSAAARDFQLVFSSEDMTARMMYTKVGRMWTVVGKVDGRGWAALVAGRSLAMDDEGRFTFQARALEKTGIELGREDRTVVIPPASEVIDG